MMECCRQVHVLSFNVFSVVRTASPTSIVDFASATLCSSYCCVGKLLGADSDPVLFETIGKQSNGFQ